jgi:hypothetical protein
MKKIIYYIVFAIIFTSCKDETDCCVNPVPVKVSLKFTHNWDGVPVSSSDFNEFKFTTKNGELISVEKLRYLVSNIKIGDNVKDYQLINIGENSGLEISFDAITIGNQRLQFTFGFSDADNKDGIYQDLNSVNFGVPGMLGGGYHFMQFDGKYKDGNNQSGSFNYHAIRAANRTNTDNPWKDLPDTSFLVDLGVVEITNNVTIEIKMNIAEWFKNPNTWNLDELNTVLMPNFEAQKLMSTNGKTVFSLGDVTQ